MKLKFVNTADNSPTLYHPDIDEHYHSVHGAVQESQHVFINAGLKEISKNKISILEIGFGTGLNALLTFAENINSGKDIYYQAIEKFPLSLETIKLLQQINTFNSVISKHINRVIWEKTHKISNHFQLKKIQIDLIDYQPKQQFDLIYFDAFAPEKQPELWTEEIFTKLYKATNENGILVTYSAKGIVKQALRNAGYIVKRLPGPKGKRHMVRAIKM